MGIICVLTVALISLTLLPRRPVIYFILTSKSFCLYSVKSLILNIDANYYKHLLDAGIN